MSLGVPPAQTASLGSKGKPQMRIDQETLASISTPDHAETRLGTLEFADGGPQQGWFIILRLDRPLASFFDKTWRPSEIPRGEVVPAPSCPSARVSRALPAEVASGLHAVNGAASNTGYADSA
jgi:hypothetical protein